MTNQKQAHAYGTWPSLLSAAQVAQGSRRFGRVQLFNGTVFWSETRPEERGRSVIMRATNRADRQTILPEGYSARSRIHEYGGGEFIVTVKGLFFVNDEDQDIYHISSEQNIARVTDVPDVRFADFCWDSRLGRLIAVAEQHDEKHRGKDLPDIPAYPENLLVSITPPQSRQTQSRQTQSQQNGRKNDEVWDVTPLVSGNDFYASPTLSPDGRTLAWLSWNLPYMPWESCELFIGRLDEAGNFLRMERLAGSGDSACFQPQWSPDGRLMFIWDRSGWGNPYVYSNGNIINLHPSKSEYARPLWSLGTNSYSLMSDNKIVASCYESGNTKINVIDLNNGDVKHLNCDLRSFDMVTAWQDIVAGIGTADNTPSAIVKTTLSGDGLPQPTFEILRTCSDIDCASEEISPGQVIEFSGRDGEPVYGLYYSPANSRFIGPDNTRSPTIINVHGGPTGTADRGFKIKSQYWTSRGFGLFDIDYSGSFGYGRAYRNRLDGCWGVRDVEDVMAGVETLIGRGLADPEKIVISGGSAGGFTVLMALARSDIFAAGASYYGVCDLQQLLNVTHKFESGYLYGLLGANPGEADSVFRDRSPLF